MSDAQKTVLMLFAGWGLGDIGYLSWRFLSAEVSDWRRHRKAAQIKRAQGAMTIKHLADQIRSGMFYDPDDDLVPYKVNLGGFVIHGKPESLARLIVTGDDK